MNETQFNYTYKAPTEQERREIESIKRQYEPQSNNESKLARLRKLNNYVNGMATSISLALGVVGLLVFGLGLAMVLEWKIITGGIIVAILGIPLIAVAYPVNNLVLNKNKKKYGKEILELSNELLNQDKSID